MAKRLSQTGPTSLGKTATPVRKTMQNHCPPKYPRKLAVTLFADVQGYSRMMGQDEDATHRKTLSGLKLFEGKIASFGGRIIRIVGDGVFAEMQSAVGAVKYAIDVQKAIAERNLDLPVEERLEFRIGINLGDVIAEQNENFGESVNIAERLQKLAYPGGICISRAVHEQVKTKLGYGFESMGEPDLKNILEPVEVYRVRSDPQSMVTLPTYRKEERPLELPAIPSVAVLPFENLSEEPGHDRLFDGITQDTTVALQRFRELFVISPHSTSVYKSRSTDTPVIGRELGVRYLIKGSFRWDGHRLRVTTELIEAASGHEIWGEHFDHFLDETFVVQDELTVKIAATLAQQIQTSERRRALQAKAETLEAYGLVLRGQELLLLLEKSKNAEAREHYEQAAQLDPGYARAYAAISRTLNYDWRYSWSQDSSGLLDRALDLANQAIHLDEFDARGYSELGFVHLYRKEHHASIAAYERALKLNPNDADMMAEMGDALVHCGHSERAVALLDKAMRLNPYYPDWYLWYLAGAHYQICQYDEAIETINKMSNPAEGRRVLAASFAQLGKTAQAEAQAREVMRVHPEFSLSHWARVQPDQNPEDVEHFIEGLRKAGLR